MTGFFLFVMFASWAMSWKFNSPAILVGGVIFSIVMNIASYWYSDKIVLSMAGATPIEEHDAPELYHILENLAITAGLPMPKLYIVEDPAPNAFATGRDPEHSAVAVTTGILKVLDKTELEGVLAHELSHIGNRDTLISTVIVVLVGFLTLLSDFFIRSTFWGDNRDRDSRLAVPMFIIGIVLALLSPIIAQLIQLAISRKREFLADASGALLTRYPEGLASALQKIADNPNEMSYASNAIAHLYIESPTRSLQSQSAMAKLFMTHPPMEERISALRGMDPKDMVPV